MLAKKTLIHTAFQAEAQSIIDFLKLQQDNISQDSKTNFKIFSNDDTILIVSGMGEKNTKIAFEEIFSKYEFEKIFNVGIAGCVDGSVKVGTTFCTNRFLSNISFGSITTLDKPLDFSDLEVESEEEIELDTLLVDMEASHFLEISKKHCKDIYVIKIVSDHLDSSIPKKSFVIELIKNSLPLWKKYL